MKTVFLKLLRLLGVDVLLAGLLHKLALGLIKKLLPVAEKTGAFLDRANANDGENKV